MFDEYFNPPPSVASPILTVIAPKHADSTGPPSTTTIEQDALSPSEIRRTGRYSKKTRLGWWQRDIVKKRESTLKNLFAPVTQLEAIRSVIAYAAYTNMIVYQMGVKTTFLDGILREEVCVSQPDIFLDQDNPNHVYKLKKALYGLKQPPRAWYGLLSSFLLSKKFSKGVVDPTLFTRKEDTYILLDSCIALTAFSYADHAGCQDTRRSTSGIFHLFGDRLHIDIKYHFIKEQVENVVVELYFVRKEYQLAYIFTKALGRERLDFLINKLEMRSMSPETLKRLAEEEEEIINPLVAQQVALDDALVAPDNRVVIGKCNIRIEPTKTQKEATYQVALDTLKQQVFRQKKLDLTTGIKFLGYELLNIHTKACVHFATQLELSENKYPDVALELAKSMSKTKAEEQEAARLVCETHKHIVTKKPTIRSVQVMSKEERLAADIKKAIKDSKLATGPQQTTGSNDDKEDDNDDDQSINLEETDDEKNKHDNDETQRDEYAHRDEYIPPLLDVLASVVPPTPTNPTPPPIPTTSTITTSEALTCTSINPDSETLFALQLRVSDLEKEVKELKQVDLYTIFHASIRSEVTPARSRSSCWTRLRVEEKKKASKDAELPKKPKSTGCSNNTTCSQPKLTGKSIQSEETVFEAANTEMSLNQGNDTGDADEQPDVEAALKQDWFKKPAWPPTPDPEWIQGKSVDNEPTQTWLNDLANTENPYLTFNDLMSTLIDFSAFAMNHLKISKVTNVDLVGPVYNLLKGTCKSYVELGYNIEECYRALSDQLDWNNPEGNRCPYDLTKPLPLQETRGRLTVPADFFLNNDLEYLKGGSINKTYTTSTTKTKVAKYDVGGIEDMIPKL
nr:retrovirus-related Pol polyprotein from transposon TNT 1-94 [Tanacetum cinerariifolium]